jgi:hypothetical protein
MVRVPSKSKSTPLIIPKCRFDVLPFTFGFPLQVCFLFAPLAEFPDDALGSELAVAARVGAGFTQIEAFLAISDFHLGAAHGSVPIRMIKAFHQGYLPSPEVFS